MTAGPFKLTKEEADIARRVACRLMQYRLEKTEQPAMSIFDQFSAEMAAIHRMDESNEEA